MTPERLRQITAQIDRRELARLLGYSSDNSLRQCEAGKQTLPADKAAWSATMRWCGSASWLSSAWCLRSPKCGRGQCVYRNFINPSQETKMIDPNVQATANRKAAEAFGSAFMVNYEMRKASEALLAIYNPAGMPNDIASACSKLMLWCAAKAAAEADAIKAAAKTP